MNRTAVDRPGDPLMNEPSFAQQVPVAPGSRRLAQIDGLRGLACLMVVAHHGHAHGGRFGWPRITLANQPFELPDLLALGYLGVDLFFVLSAFCLTYPIFLKCDLPTDWSRFFRNRVIRILPPYWASIALWIVLWGVIHTTQIEPWYSQKLLGWPSPLAGIAGLLLIVTIYNPSYWTLCLEARWYLILPLILWIVRRIGMAGVMVFACLSSIAYCQAIHYVDTSRSLSRAIYLATSLPLFLPTFVLGIYVARATAIGGQICSASLVRLLRLAFFVAIVLTGLFLPKVQEFDLLRAGVGGVFASTLLALAIYDPWTAKILSWKPLDYVGTISYSLYLIHEPLIRLAYSMTGRWNWPEWQQFCFYELLFPAVLVLLASAFYRLFEFPWIRRSAPVAIAASKQEP